MSHTLPCLEPEKTGYVGRMIPVQLHRRKQRIRLTTLAAALFFGAAAITMPAVAGPTRLGNLQSAGRSKVKTEKVDWREGTYCKLLGLELPGLALVGSATT